MHILLTFMLLGGLTVTGVSSNPTSSKSKPDFSALNKYLFENASGNDNVQDNMDPLRSNIHQLTGGLRVAGQKMLDLYDQGDQCSKMLPSLLRSSVGRDKDLQVCWKYIKSVYKRADPGLTDFFESFGPYGARCFGFHSYTDLSNTGIYRALRGLASDDPELKFEYEATRQRPSEIKYRAKFEKAFEELLVKPCKRVLSDKQLLVTMPAITLAQFNMDKPGYLDKKLGIKRVLTMSQQVTAMNWTRRKCEEFINMDSSARTRVFNNEE